MNAPDTAAPPVGAAPSPWRRFRVVAFVGALVCGAALRLAFPGDIEWKGDEQWMFARSQRVGRSEPWPIVGMTSGGGLPNPGQSVWVFVALARITGADDPRELARAVAVLNVAALGLLAALALGAVRPPERAPWLWGAALAAVNPIAVLLHRKIWAQSVLPIGSVLFLWGFLRRDRRSGAALWGVMGPLLGQVHLSGFFFAAGVAAWEAAIGRLRPVRPATRWRWFLAGSVVGAAPLVPWIRTLAAGAGRARGVAWRNLVSGEFWKDWVMDATGLGMDYSLGPHFSDWLRFPSWASVPTRLVLAAHAVAVVAGAIVIGRWLWRWLAARGFLHPRRTIGSWSETDFTVAAAVGGYGLLLTLSGVTVFRHYLIVSFPLAWVWLASLALRQRRGRALLAALFCAEILLSTAFLGYIHVRRGAPEGDYGRTYSARVPDRAPSALCACGRAGRPRYERARVTAGGAYRNRRSSGRNVS